MILLETIIMKVIWKIELLWALLCFIIFLRLLLIMLDEILRFRIKGGLESKNKKNLLKNKEENRVDGENKKNRC